MKVKKIEKELYASKPNVDETTYESLNFCVASINWVIQELNKLQELISEE